jgi:hypothetical protein
MRTKLVVVSLLLLLSQGVRARPQPGLSEVDRVRLAEAFRIGDALGERVWEGWGKAPFAVLLVTPENEFLIRHPRPSKDFTHAGYDPLLKSDVYLRHRTQPINLLATFPAVGGVSTIVIGQAENTAKKTSTPWVLTVLHEHFHQLQSSQPTYYAEVEALKLARGDQTGMWMLNFAFPYKDARVKEQFSALSKLLADALRAQKRAEFSSKLGRYLEARRSFRQALGADDYRYFSFQLWQEGIARYTELRVAELAAKRYKPSREFRALKDYTPFKEVADAILNGQILDALDALRLDESERVAFYPFGAAEGLLLDRASPGWHGRYFAEKFYTDAYFGASR